MNSRGQAGFVGEDLIALVVVVLSLVSLMVYVNHLFSKQAITEKGLEESQTAWFIAEAQAKKWSYGVAKQGLNKSLLCTDIPELIGYDLSFKVTDLRDNLTLCERGPKIKGKIASLPVVIYYNLSKKNPGILDVAAAKKQDS